MFIDFYFKHYKKLLLIPLALLLLSLIIITIQAIKTGDIAEKDITLKGGIAMSVYVEHGIEDIETRLSNNLGPDIVVRKLTEFGSDKEVGFIVETSSDDPAMVDTLKAGIEKAIGTKLTSEDYSIEQTGAGLGRAFYRQMSIAIAVAFALMAITMFTIFRKFVPAFAVVFSAFSDIVITLGVMNIFSIKLSTSGIAALLLLIGYSVDTDILLTTRTIKRKEGTIQERVLSSIKTGLTMTFTTIAALAAGYAISDSLIIKNMFLIILIGLCTDIIVTYLFNAGILTRYLSRVEKVD